MGPVRSYPTSARSLPDESLSSLQYWPWVGVGVLLAFVFLSFVLGGLERLRENSVGEVEERSKKVADQSGEIKVHEDEMMAQKDKIRAQKDEMRAQKDKIRAQKDEMKTQKGKIKTQKDKIKTQKNKIKAQKDKIRTHQNSIRTLKIGRDELTGRVRTLNMRKTRLEDQNKALDQTLQERNAELGRNNTTIARLRSGVASKDEEIAKKTKTLQGKNAELGRNNTTITQLRNEVASKDEEIAEKNQTIAANEVTIGDLRLAKNRVNQDLITARGRIRDLEGREEQLERRINFSQEVTANNEDAYAETIDNLEERIRDLRLEKNRLTGDLTGAQRTMSHNERTIARLERMIDFLQQRTADLDGDETREERGNRMLSIMPGSWQENLPQEEDASDMEKVPGATGSSIRDVQIQQLIIGLQQMLHLQGPCRHVELGGTQVAEIDSIVRHTTDLMDRLNDAMHQELVLLVLDIMSHLGIGQ